MDSDNDGQNNLPEGSRTPENPSPMDTRGFPRFEAINEAGDEELRDSGSTGRRQRPSQLAHGSASSSNAPVNQESRTPETQSGMATPTQTQDPNRPGVRSMSSSTHDRLKSPEPLRPQQRQRPASMTRKTSVRGPQRGQEFSVDDAAAEYELDLKQQRQQQQSQSTSVQTASHAPYLRRQPSTVRRRQTMVPPQLPRVQSSGGEEEESPIKRSKSPQPQAPKTAPLPTTDEPSPPEEPTPALTDDETPQEEDDLGEGEDEGDDSDAESFTLKDRQQAINATHPFGIRIWKPALYKKQRSVEKTAEGDIHSSPGGKVSRWLWFFNFLWTVLFGWWLALVVLVPATICFALGFADQCTRYGRVLFGLSGYLFYPFGKFVRLEHIAKYADEDEGEGRSITEYEQWQSGDIEDGRLFFGPLSSRAIEGRRRGSVYSGDDEEDSLLGRTATIGSVAAHNPNVKRKRYFGRGKWTFGRVLFFVFFYFLIAPLMLLVSGICWSLVFWIPMGKVLTLLFYHLRKHPLVLSFHADASYSRDAGGLPGSVLLCTYRAVNSKYWKYTIDGTNIFLINLLGIVIFTIFDYFVLEVWLGIHSWITHPGLIFCLALFSVIPLAYFIGQAVASISAQSSMGVGATINAFFSTVVEVFLYCVALNQGKGKLVEGSIVGSIFAGILFLPGLSMCFGALHRKTQRFNVKSAGVTSTMLLFAMIGAFGPTLFYQIYGSHEINCHSCHFTSGKEEDSDCRRCFYSQVPAVTDKFFIEAVRPYCWFAAALLFLSYVIGLLFTLRTHAATIWNDSLEDEKKPHAPLPSAVNGSISHHFTSQESTKKHRQATPGKVNVQDSQLYQQILNQSLRTVGLHQTNTEDSQVSHVNVDPGQPAKSPNVIPYIIPPRSSGGDGSNLQDHELVISSLSEEQNQQLVQHVAEIAATAATIAARDAVRAPKKIHLSAQHRASRKTSKTPLGHNEHEGSDALAAVEEMSAVVGPGHDQAGEHGGGHDAPNWSRTKSAVILLGATLLYAIIAEILVDTVDVVLQNVKIDEKFLGITLFALVPNTTEFLNAISFAMNGNIALSMEIGSAYALQVCLLQIPALVAFSAIHGQYIDAQDLLDHTFNLIFPQWDMVTVILCVFLLSYVYGEGKSNYFKGSVLILTYLVVVVGFYLSGLSYDQDMHGLSQYAAYYEPHTSKTVGRGRSGVAHG